MSGNIINMRGVREAPRNVRSKMETLLLTPDTLNEWALPGFQRDLRENEKVRMLAEEVKSNGGFVPGIVTLGTISGSKTVFILDGQHRRHAALMSGLLEFICDVRICSFDDMAEMGKEYVRLNSSLAKMRPDDILRGLESSVIALRRIREECKFVGYDHVRRGTNTGSTIMIGMSSVLRFWRSSSTETPGGNSGGSAIDIAAGMDTLDVDNLIRFMLLAKQAWGSDVEYYRLWNGLNLVLCMWLYHQLVLNKDRGVKRRIVLNNDQFKKCLMSVSASADYLDWLPGRTMNDQARSPCFIKLKAIFAKRIEMDTGARPMLPGPAWASR